MHSRYEKFFQEVTRGVQYFVVFFSGWIISFISKEELYSAADNRASEYRRMPSMFAWDVDAHAQDFLFAD